MSEYIDRETVLLQMQKAHSCGRLAAKSAMRIVGNCPTADVVPVQHGRWKHLLEFYWECSECGTFGLGTDLYCRNCGAKMDGGGNNDENT